MIGGSLDKHVLPHFRFSHRLNLRDYKPDHHHHHHLHRQDDQDDEDDQDDQDDDHQEAEHRRVVRARSRRDDSDCEEVKMIIKIVIKMGKW